ncbi:DUF4959 domain-containing protein [Butyricimonas paravirosa]|uniref:DUF4959 domain-containing protein n=1 Tax=Butyricimonas paravirosa TaxID=1472417 RepID=UPI0022E29838|nr:DUF4959 domain-containing protein [Butyricimonas paravirosa]
MKRILFISFILLAFWRCNDDDVFSFGSLMSQENIHFKAQPGGAMMYYKLPDESDIFGINVRYKDARNIEVLKTSDYGGDSLFLDGFNEACQGITARVTLVDNKGNESTAMEVTFNTEESAPYAFIDRAKVLPSWGGFQVLYESPGQASGMAHIFYLGTNPLTQEPDTILVKSFPILKGGDTLTFPLAQMREKNTIIVRTEDFRGYRVGQKIWPDIETYISEKLPLTMDNFDAGGKSLERDDLKVGLKYLFDGDLKGNQRMVTGKSKEMFTFLAGPDAVGKPMFVDLEEERVPASIRIYGILNMKLAKPAGNPWNQFPEARMPCDVIVYGGNDKNGNTWDRLGTFVQSPTLTPLDRWNYPCDQNNSGGSVNDLETLEAAEPCYMEVSFFASPARYRYLKIVVNDTFELGGGYASLQGDFGNHENYVAMHELEVYVKKD